MDSSREKNQNENRWSDRVIHLRPANSGVEVVFFSLVVKLDSLRKQGDGDVLFLLNLTGDVWRTDGVLCSTVAMGLDDLGETIAFLENLCLQSKNTPVDFYILAIDIGDPWYLTHNDGELEFLRDEDNRTKVRLKNLRE